VKTSSREKEKEKEKEINNDTKIGVEGRQHYKKPVGWVEA
jgi:hypothetical protein